jgi:hypothetical protein
MAPLWQVISVAQTGVQDCAILAVFAIAIFAVIACILRIPEQTGHAFHGKLDSHSRANWTLIPR